MQDKTIGIGIIGAGSRGVTNLASKIIEKSGVLKMDVVAVCDSNAQRLGEAEAALNKQINDVGKNYEVSAYLSSEELVKDPKVDMVVITTPQDFHEQPFISASKEGKLIYCDKPLAASAQACRRMCNVYKQRGQPCIIGFTRRYEATWMKAHELIEQGVIGAPKMLLLRSVIPYHTYFHRWFRKRAQSGGVLNEKSAHHFDVLRWFADGSMPVSVNALAGRDNYIPKKDYPRRCCECDFDCAYRVPEAGLKRKAQDAHAHSMNTYKDDPQERLINDHCVYSPEADIYDNATVTLQYANGMRGVLFLSIFGPSTEDQETLEVVGSTGRLRLVRHRGQIDLVTDYGKKHEQIDARDSLHDTSHFGADYRLVNTMSKFSHQGIVPPAGFDDAYIASMTAFAARDSADSGGTLVDLTNLDAACKESLVV